MYRLTPVSGITDHVDVRLCFQQEAQSVAHHSVIVGQKN
jgi:hypothetical protein